MSFRVINGVMYPVVNFPTVEPKGGSESKTQDVRSGKSFDNILKSKIDKSNSFNISKHAAERLEKVNLSDEDMKIINNAINKAHSKGARNCLILYKDVALVTSIENRTVITAVEGERMKDNVFTNIDSVMML